MAKKPAKPKDNTAAVAAQFGISLKALRLYEQLGLLKAPRTQAGWRIYGQAEVERLHAILSLKQLGLPLARIAELFKAGPTDLGSLLSVQEEMLRESRREADHAIALIRIAKVRIRENRKLSAEELSALIRTISGTLIRMTPQLEALAQRIYPPDQLDRVVGREQTPEEAARISAFWTQIMADIDALLPDGDPLSKKGLGIARRVAAFIGHFTQGDKDLWNNAARFWHAAVSDPSTAQQMPMSKERWDFMAKALGELQRRGELKP
jgi:MerR family transcriptional regulator, thiopeptide resistance regulator